ncbi:MAG TPA: hypothetical protein VGD08_26800 [Stellaceae bacterium]
MSEYQYYEFQAIDRPLDEAAQGALRQISTRARITARSLVNTYQWGDFKGDPRRLIEDWFDLFVYWANWGSRTLMLRVPRRFLDPAEVEPYRLEDVVDLRAVGDYVIVEFHRPLGDSVDDFYGDEDEEGEESISAPFAALRADLMRGDRRCLYFGWLLGVQEGLVDEDEPEPPLASGLARASGPLVAFRDFFGLDRDLFDAAIGGGADEPVPDPSPDELGAFVAQLPDAEKTSLLRRVVLENDPHVALDVRHRWSATVRTPELAAARKPRTAGELLAAAEVRAQERERLAAERAAAEQARHAEQERKAREQRLARLAGRVEEAWREVDALAETKKPAEYDKAVGLLKDLEALADRDGKIEEFRRRFGRLRDRHERKTALLKRLIAVGLNYPGTAASPG